MKLVLALTFILTTATSFAHIKYGTYRGMDGEGKTCEMVVIEKGYEYNEKHPLNEVVHIGTTLHQGFSLRHKAILNGGTQEITVDKTSLLGQRGFKGINKMFKLFMSHVEGNEGPSMFEIRTFDPAESLTTYEMCLGLVWVNPGKNKAQK